MSNCVNSPGSRFADSVIANPHLFSLARIFSTCGDYLRVGAAGGSERGFRKGPIDGASLATARGADSSTRVGFFLSASRLHFVFVALIHEGGKELRAQGAASQETPYYLIFLPLSKFARDCSQTLSANSVTNQ